MKLSVNGRKMEISEALRQKIEKKMGKFNRFFDEDAQATVVLSMEKSRQKVEITVVNGGTILRAQEVTNDMYSSLDGAAESLERQMRRYKTRLEKRLHQGAYDSFDFSRSEDVEEEKEFEIIKVKHFPVKPMSAEEAILQMNLLGHEFFVFRNADGTGICAVYRRKDGKYGILAPSEVE